MKAPHNVFTRRSTVRFISCDGHQLYDFKERGIDLQVEGVRYIEMHRGPYYLLGPPPSRDVEGGVTCPCGNMA